MYQYFLYPNNTIVNVVHLEIDIAGTDDSNIVSTNYKDTYIRLQALKE